MEDGKSFFLQFINKISNFISHLKQNSALKGFSIQINKFYFAMNSFLGSLNFTPLANLSVLFVKIYLYIFGEK